MSFPKNISRAAIDQAARKMITDIFNKAAAESARFEQVPCYHPDWDNIDNDGFIANATFESVHCIVSGSFTPDERGYIPGNVTVRYDDEKGLQGVGLTYATDGQPRHLDDRLQEVLAFADSWRKQQQAEFSAPRLVALPGIKEHVLWLEGPRNVFIPVSDFHTKAGDPIAVDDKYLDKVRTKYAALREMYKDADPEAGGGGLLGGGGASRRLRPPGS